MTDDVMSKNVEVVRVRYLNERREFHIPSAGIPLAEGDIVIVETEEGMDACEVVAAASRCPPRPMETPEATPLRKATAHDLEWLETKRATEEEAAAACRELARELGLEMKLASVKLSFDGSKLVFSFTADQRVDFRALVRELAKRFHTRVEMKQIGVRDKARQLGGLGICGRVLCCTAFLREFAPVTMKMAKEQDLALSPTKISGVCGRLMCCLGYENEVYRTLREKLPQVGTRVKTPAGEGEIKEVLPLKNAIVVALDDGVTVKVTRDDLQPVDGGRGKPAGR